MAVSGVTAGTTPTVVDKDKTGFNGLTSQDFLKLLVTQLQNQDPTAPVGNEELLNQLSTMRSLQSNIELGDGIKAITTGQNLATAASFIGRTVTGAGADGKQVSGTVEKAYLTDGTAFVRVGGTDLSLSQITEVDAAG